MKNFCPAPWISLFYNTDKARICCISRYEAKQGPEEFLNSDYVKELRQSFLNDEKHESCASCWKAEESNLQSMRDHYFHRHPLNIEELTIDKSLPLEHMEIKTSNLCNFACRMCTPASSIELHREAITHPELASYYRTGDMVHAKEMSQENWDELLAKCSTLSTLFITGGEPMLIKRNYELLDYLIENGYAKNISVTCFTNCSVYNPIFLEKLSKFKWKRLMLSIDATGPIAEYQRYGTDWKTVRSNILKFFIFAKKANAAICFNTVLSAYTILDVNATVDFFLELYADYDARAFNAHSIAFPSRLHFEVLPEELRARALEQIELAIPKLFKPEFKQFLRELHNIKTIFVNKPIVHTNQFVELTYDFDQARNQRFEDVFNYKLY